MTADHTCLGASGDEIADDPAEQLDILQAVT